MTVQHHDDFDDLMDDDDISQFLEEHKDSKILSQPIKKEPMEEEDTKPDMDLLDLTDDEDISSFLAENKDNLFLKSEVKMEDDSSLHSFNPKRVKLGAKKLNTPVVKSSMMMEKCPTNIDPLDVETLNKLYYMFLFPCRQFYRWLNYGVQATRSFTHREFSFTTLDDIYIRYQSFDDEAAFKDRLIRVCPVKIDIGAIYNAKPKEKKMLAATAFSPQAKEFVLDIDLTDYDEVRTCCSGGDICLKCWEFMKLAMKIIQRALTEDFGFKHILWVYSGRRGVHAWVCDTRARTLDNEIRKSIIGYLDIIKGGAAMSRKVSLPQVLHPSLEAIMPLIEESFEKIILNEQDLFNGPKEKWIDIVKGLPDELRSDVENNWSDMANHKTSSDRWNYLVNALERYRKSPKGKKMSALTTFVRDIKLQCCYPRLDSNVSIALNHLLKAPFCIHPKTRKICVPIPIDQFDSFDPMEVPTDHTLLTEYSENDGGLKSTQLHPYIRYFQSFIDKVASPKPQIPSLEF